MEAVHCQGSAAARRRWSRTDSTQFNSIQSKSSPVQPSRSGATNRRLLKRRSPKSANKLLQQLCVSLPPEGTRTGAAEAHLGATREGAQWMRSRARGGGPRERDRPILLLRHGFLAADLADLER